jgi:hypothetical protein
MDLKEAEFQHHVALGVAVSTVYARTVGVQPSARNFEKMISTLSSVARAIADLIPIYSSTDSATPKQIPSEHLREATFTRGGRSLTTKDGTEYAGLTIRRPDMEMAIEELRRRQEALVKPPSDRLNAS